MKRTPLQRKTALKRSGSLKRGKSRLKPKPKTLSNARAWKEALFATWGPWCYFHANRTPPERVEAVDPGHIIRRSKMGAAIAYGAPGGPPDPRLGRPLCRECHDLEDVGKLKWPLALRQQAVEAHNEWAVSKLIVPTQ